MKDHEPVGVTTLKAFAYRGRMCMPGARFTMSQLESTAYARRGFVEVDKPADPAPVPVPARQAVAADASHAAPAPVPVPAEPSPEPMQQPFVESSAAENAIPEARRGSRQKAAALKAE